MIIQLKRPNPRDDFSGTHDIYMTKKIRGQVKKREALKKELLEYQTTPASVASSDTQYYQNLVTTTKNKITALDQTINNSVESKANWTLVTTVDINNPINNPWTGSGESGSPAVSVPLNTLSDNYGLDLEIKIEWDNTGNGSTSKRYYKGWRLDEVFDYTRTAGSGTSGTVYTKWKENDNWYSSTQHSIVNDDGWNWNFHQGTGSTSSYTESLSGVIGYNNAGLLISSGAETAGAIYSGTDENGSYSNYTSWSSLRVYVKYGESTLTFKKATLRCINPIANIDSFRIAIPWLNDSNNATNLFNIYPTDSYEASKNSLLIPVDPSSRFMTHTVDIGYTLTRSLPHYYQVAITDSDGKKISQSILNNIAEIQLYFTWVKV